MSPVHPRQLLLVFLLLVAAVCAVAGGGPENVLVVVNTRSAESLEIGNQYRRARAIPYRNLVTLTTSTAYAVSPQVYLEEIETPIRAYLHNQQLDDDITTIVLTRGVPQIVLHDTVRAVASLLATMGMDKTRSTGRLQNPYYKSTAPFSRRQSTLAGMYLVTTLTGYSTRDITQLIARGIEADGTAPDGRFLLHGSPQIPADAQEAAAALLVQRGLHTEVVTTLPADRTNLMGYFSGGIFSGLSREILATMAFHPGAIADMAQPYGAAAANLDEGATSMLIPAGGFVQAGITGLHAVVGDAGMETIPAAGRQSLVLDRYTTGLSLAESFYAALPLLNGQNLIIGDPLCAPYARRSIVTLEMGDAPLSGTAAIKVLATSPDRGQTIQRVDLYLDDQFCATLYEPLGAVVNLRIGDRVLEYPIPPGADMQALLDGLAAHVNVHPELSKADGVRAVPSLATASLHLIARSPGTEGNDIPVSIAVESELRPTVELSARLSGDRLTGGGQEPAPARGSISFLGRRVKAGDEITVKIGPERITYTVPEEGATFITLLEALATRINAVPAFTAPGGVRAARDPQGMPVLLLEARAPGEDGNRIPYSVSLKAVEGSTLRAYPEVPVRLMGGFDGSSASVQIAFVLGEPSVRRTFLLDTAKLCDGFHRLRAVAYDGSPAQVQGFVDASVQVKNIEAPPTVTLPAKLGPVSGEAIVPVTAGETVKQVDIYVDGQLLGTADMAPFSIRVPLHTLGRGTHDLWAEGIGENGRTYRSATIPLEVLVAPEITRATPDHCILAGGVTHRIIGTGFQPDCTVRLAGVPAKKVTYLSPNMLDVVSDAGPARRGWIEVTNPDGMVATLPNAFEYYVPRVSSVQLSPTRDILRPKQSAQYTALCFDQYKHPIQATVMWEANGGVMTQAGTFTAPATTGQYSVRATHPDSVKGWDIPITVGQEELRDGVLKQWLILGPFADDDAAGLATAYISETTVQPSHSETLAGLTWRSYASPTSFIDLTAQLTPKTNVVAYAHVYLKAPAEMDCALVLGSDDGIALWLNGDACYSLRARRPADPNQTTLPIHLRVGWNRLLVKVDQATGGWGFYLRLQTRDRKPLTGLYYALDNPIVPIK